MGLITKNGRIHIINSPKGGKQKAGFVTKNGRLSILIPYKPTDVVAEDPSTDLGFSAVNGVAVGSIAAVSGVAKASISKVSGV
tara:strand:- start:2115 stop:2363 length:249 start_codon:yes stop_codon:yes gene_type:complete